jgi:heme exporter protein A
VLAIMGHNGSGKSTLLRVAATAIRATRGTGTVFGAELVREAQVVRSMVALLSTEPGVYGDLTALENLRFAARMLGTTGDALDLQRALDRVGLGREGHERARNMSSGMQRRLSIARLLLREPHLLLLDEPYNSLDPEGARLVNTLIRETRARGGSVLLVAHDLSRSEGLADRTLEMRDGLLVEAAESVDEEDTTADFALDGGRGPVEIAAARRLRVERGGAR